MDGTKMRFLDLERRPFPPTRVLLVILLCSALFISITPFFTLISITAENGPESNNYHTYEEMVSEIQEIEINHSSIIIVHNLTTTYEGRTVWAIKVSDEPEMNDSAEPDVLFMAGQKANSLISVEMALYLLNYLTSNYGVDNKVTEMVNNREIWILPMVNPDGHEYIGNGTEDWEKNRQKITNEIYGVNLNRNYGFNWGVVDSYTSDQPQDQYYFGPEPFSENETKAIKNLVESQDFVFSLSFSSHGNTITYPWGHTDSSTPDDDLLHEIAYDMALYLDYDVIQSGDRYINHGNVDDWLYNNSNILPFTVLLGNENIPDDSQLENMALEKIPACLYLLDIAGDPNQARRAQWTFMVYMGADNNLEPDGIRDFNEMEMVGSNPYVNIVVQFDRAVGFHETNPDWTDTRRFLVLKDHDTQMINSPMLESIGEANMADHQVLLDFVNWSITNYPAEHYFLDIWGHGKGWLGVTDDNGNYLSMAGIKSILPKFKDRIDVVGFDNCNMAMIEVYTQFIGHVDYIVGSEKEEDAWGWPYDRIFNDLKKNPNTSPLNLSSQIVTHYVEWASEPPPNGSQYSATVSVVDMSYLYEVINRTDALASDLNWSFALYKDEILEVINDTEDYDKSPNPYDLYNFAELVKKYVPNGPIQMIAQDLMNGIETLILYEDHLTKHNDMSVDNAHGIAVWLYEGSESNYNIYKSLDFAALTEWDEFLFTYKNPPSKPEVYYQLNYSLSDSDDDDNYDTIELLSYTDVSDLDIITKVYNSENQHITTFYKNRTSSGEEYSNSFNPKDYGYPSDYYNFYSYLVNDENVLQNYSQVIAIWLGNQKPNVVLKNLTFYREDGTPVGGNTSKKPIDGENTLIKAVVLNDGTTYLSGVKIEFYEGDNLINSEIINLGTGEEKNITASWLARAGDRSIRVVLDGENLIKETNESNNNIIEDVNVKPNIPVTSLIIKGKVYNRDKINIIGASVQIKNMRTNQTMNKTTNEKGYNVELKEDFFLEGDMIDVKASYAEAKKNVTVYAYSEDEIIFANLTLDTEVYDAVFFFKIGLIIFEIIGFILVIKYYIGMKRKK